MIPLYLVAVGLGGGFMVSFGVACDKQRVLNIGAVIAIIGVLGAVGTALV